MIFDRITLHNFGVYLGRHELLLRPENRKKPIILIGGLNGVGKTTLLDAFQLGLFGKLANCSNKGTLAYDKYLKKCTHKSANPKDGSAITISFRHTANGTEHKYQVTRSWRLNKKTLTENVEVLCDGKTDPILAESWYEYVEQFIPIRISSLFFFDGEKIKNLADFNKSSALIATGINQLLGLDLVDRLITDLVVIEKRKTLCLSNNHERKRIELLEKKAYQLNSKREDLAQQQQASEEAVSAIDDQISEIDELFRIEGGDLYREREMLEYKKAEIKKRVREIKQKLVDITSGIMPLVVVEPLLEKILDQSRKEEVDRHSEQMNSTLQKRDHHIISELKKRKIPKESLVEIEQVLKRDIDERTASKSRKRYLNMDAGTIDSLSKLLQESLNQECSGTLEIMNDMVSCQIEAERLDRKLAQIPDADVIAQIIKKKEELVLTQRKAQVNRDIIGKEYGELLKIIALTTTELEKEYEKEITAEYSHETASRIITHSNKSRKTLELFKERVVAYHLDRIQRYVLISFKGLLRKEALVTGIHIDPQTYQIDFMGPYNKVVDLSRLSAGEKQLLSVSLLWGLAQASGRRLPAIIDTPLGRLDTTHRTHLIKRYFPNASHQVLLLSTDEEINEKYYNMIRPWVSKAYRLEFDESKQTTNIKPGYFW